MSEVRQRYEQLLQRPEVRSLLNTIRFAEGTAGDEGYRTMFGGGKFDVSGGWKHPQKTVKTSGYESAAAGGYQFLPGTWQSAKQSLGLQDFSPKAQDLAALHLIERRGALDPFLKGEKFGTVMNKLAPEWASLPTAAGGSYYGQPSKKLGDLYNYYEQQKKQIGAIPATPQTPQQQPQKQPGMPNINIYVTGGGKVKEVEGPLDFLKKFMRGAKAKERSFIPSAMDLAKEMTSVPTTNYFG